jgi:hypothetical protein
MGNYSDDSLDAYITDWLVLHNYEDIYIFCHILFAFHSLL